MLGPTQPRQDLVPTVIQSHTGLHDRPMVGSFTNIRTSSKLIRNYFVGKAIKIPLKWGVNQLSRVRNKEFKCSKMVRISNAGSVPKTVLAFCVYRAQFFHMAGHFTKKCFYFMIFDCYELKLSVSKNWQLFSNFNTHQFWSQKTAKNQLGTLFWA